MVALALLSLLCAPFCAAYEGEGAEEAAAHPELEEFEISAPDVITASMARALREERAVRGLGFNV